jgi:cytochrome c oxidase subunit 3
LASQREGAIFGTLLTIILAVVFTALQGFEYAQSYITIADSVFGSAFFCATGLHGIHVIVGTIFITVSFIRIIIYHLTNTHHQGFEASILY